MPSEISSRQSLGKRSRSGSLFGGVLLLLFGFAWCAFLLFLDLDLMGKVWQQNATTEWPSTEAVILKSEVSRKTTSKGRASYGLEVLYRYSVDGATQTNDQYAAQAVRSSDRDWTRARAKELKRGAQVTCYYNPSNPSEAVLRRGIDGSDLFILMFLTPFHAVAAAILWGGASVLWHGIFGSDPKVRRRPGRLEERIFIGDWHPFGIFLAALGFGTFIAIFVVAIPFGFHPSLNVVLAIWGAVFLWALWAAVSNWLKKREGVFDLVLDFNSGTLSIPALHGRETREIVPFAEIEQITAREVPSPTRRNKRRTTNELILRTRRGEEFILKKPSTLDHGQQWANWLQARIRGMVPPSSYEAA